MIDRFLTILIIVCGLTTANHACAHPLSRQQATERIVDLLMDCRFDAALVIADSLRRARPDDPAGPFFQLCTRALRDTDYGGVDDSTLVYEAYREVVRRIEACDRIHGTCPRRASVDGLAKAVYAAHCLNAQKYSPGVSTGLQSLRILKEVKEANPLDYDADFILGMYDYGKSELRQRLKWVLFWYPGTKQRGIELLERCRDSAGFSSRAAELALCDIYTKERRYEQARSCISALAMRYPQSRFVLWSQAKYYEAVKDKAGLLETYTALAQSYERIPKAWRNYLHTRAKRAEALSALGRNDEAVLLCRSILEDCRGATDPYAKTTCKEVRDLLRSLER